MKSAKYCALITLDKTGHPVERTMGPFLPDNKMVVWLGTNLNSRKVKQIKNDSRISLYYQAPNGIGYVMISGNAYLINDPLKKQEYGEKEWSTFYPDKASNYILIKVFRHKQETQNRNDKFATRK